MSPFAAKRTGTPHNSRGPGDDEGLIGRHILRGATVLTAALLISATFPLIGAATGLAATTVAVWIYRARPTLALPYAIAGTILVVAVTDDHHPPPPAVLPTRAGDLLTVTETELRPEMSSLPVDPAAMVQACPRYLLNVDREAAIAADASPAARRPERSRRRTQMLTGATGQPIPGYMPQPGER